MKKKWTKPWADVTARERSAERCVRASMGIRLCDGFSSIADICVDLGADGYTKEETIDAVNRLYQRGKIAASLDKTKVHPI